MEDERRLKDRREAVQHRTLNRRIQLEPTDDLIDTRTLSDQVYQYLTDKILEGEIGYGERLNIRELAGLLHVSAMPVREALIRLSLENVVTIKPRSTCVVKTPTRKSMLEAFEIREFVELQALKKIWSTVEEDQLGDLEQYLAQMDRNLPTNNEDLRMREYAKYDQLFHQEFVVLARNASLLRIYRTNMMHLNIVTTFRAGVQPNMAQVNADHRSIVEHLRNNSEQAVEVLRRHLDQCRKNMTEGELFNSLQ
jgi:DNA-binding GntR family transcriptional regulator